MWHRFILTAPSSGPQVLAALFNTNVHLSEVMAAATAQVNYQVDNSGNSYTATGPSFAPFTIDVPYPAGQPSSDAKVHPVYSGDGSIKRGRDIRERGSFGVRRAADHGRVSAWLPGRT